MHESNLYEAQYFSLKTIFNTFLPLHILLEQRKEVTQEVRELTQFLTKGEDAWENLDLCRQEIAIQWPEIAKMAHQHASITQINWIRNDIQMLCSDDDELCFIADIPGLDQIARQNPYFCDNITAHVCIFNDELPIKKLMKEVAASQPISQGGIAQLLVIIYLARSLTPLTCQDLIGSNQNLNQIYTSAEKGIVENSIVVKLTIPGLSQLIQQEDKLKEKTYFQLVLPDFNQTLNKLEKLGKKIILYQPQKLASFHNSLN